MIVQCPYCATRYRIDAARLGAASPMLKCSRCDHVFPPPSSNRKPSSGSPSGTEKSGRPRAEKLPPAEESLTLPFESASWKPEPEEETAAAPAQAEEFTIPETDDEFTIGADEPVAAPAPEPLPEPETEAEIDEEPAFTRPARRFEAVAEPRHTAERQRARRASPRDSERGKMVALFFFLGAVVIGYFVLTMTLFATPSLWDRWLGHLPYVGTLRDDRLLNRKVALSDVTGSYQRIKDGKEVFVITGNAMNTSPVALHGVQIAGKLFDDVGRALDEKTIHCGNVISTKVLKDLTRRELSVLQTLSPPSKFMIEPGESSTFVIVFMDPPRAAVAFTTQVVAAHRQA